MRELFALLILFALLWVGIKTEIPAKAVAATERWLDGQATCDSDASLAEAPSGAEPRSGGSAGLKGIAQTPGETP